MDMNDVIRFQLTNYNHADRHHAKVVQVRWPAEWYGQSHIVCKIWHTYYFGSMVRIMFLSSDDSAMYRDFDLGDVDLSWKKAREVYKMVPRIVDDKWFERHGFEHF